MSVGSKNSILAGCLICPTGASSAEEHLAKRLTRQLGGQFSLNFDPKQVTHLIVIKVGSRKHEMAIRHKIWTVTLQWLVRCESESSRLDELDFSVGPFAGLNISVTQLNLEERLAVKSKVEAGGGIFSSDLRQDACTHLIARSPNGDKYSAARSWGGIWLVNTKWIDDCVASKGWCSEKKYPVLSEFEISSNSKLSSKTQLSKIETKIETNNTVDKVVGTNEEKEFALLTEALRSSDQESGISSHKLYSSFFAAYFDTLDTDNTKKKYSFDPEALAGQVIYIGGFSSQAEVLIRQLVCLGGGMRHEMLTEEVTIALLSSNASDRLKRSVVMHPLKALPMSLHWLLRTVIKGWLLPTDSNLIEAIQRNKNSQLEAKSSNRLVSNSYQNYPLFLGDECKQEMFDTLKDTVRSRPVIMTWNKRDKPSHPDSYNSRTQDEDWDDDTMSLGKRNSNIFEGSSSSPLSTNHTHLKHQRPEVFQALYSFPPGESQIAVLDNATMETCDNNW